MRNGFCAKDWNLLFLQKNIKYYDYLLPFQLLFREVDSSNLLIFDKQCVPRRLQDSVYSSFQQVSKIFDKNLPDEEIKALTNLTENKDLVIQKADKGNSIVILKKKRLYFETYPNSRYHFKI